MSEYYKNNIKTTLELIGIALADLCSVFLIFELSVLIRRNLPRLFPSAFSMELQTASLKLCWWILLVWLFFLWFEGVYSKRLSFWDEVKALWKVTLFSTLGVFTIVSIGKLSGEVSRTVIVLMAVLSLVMLPVIRITTKRMLRRYLFLKRRVLILGAGEAGMQVLNALKREPNYGYEVVGFVDDDPSMTQRCIEGVKVHRGLNKIVSYLNRCNISDVFIAMPGLSMEKLQILLNNLQHKVDRVSFVPPKAGMAVLGTRIRHFFHEQMFALEINNNLALPLNNFIKRCFDLILSMVLLPVLFIPMIVMALFIRSGSKGPALLFQERMGKGGRKFNCIKFRTMYADAEERLNNLLENDPARKKEWATFWKLKDDPRVTKAGMFLRKTSLDELPQILNVLKGEMSFVGPRPVTEDEIKEYYKESADICYSVLPGITGLWQVSGRNNTSYDYRIALDAWYVRNWNLWLDTVILLKTIWVVIKREGAW